MPGFDQSPSEDERIATNALNADTLTQTHEDDDVCYVTSTGVAHSISDRTSILTVTPMMWLRVSVNGTVLPGHLNQACSNQFDKLVHGLHHLVLLLTAGSMTTSVLLVRVSADLKKTGHQISMASHMRGRGRSDTPGTPTLRRRTIQHSYVFIRVSGGVSLKTLR